MQAKVMESCNCKKRLEARVGIEPTHKGFADLSLTTWVPRLVQWGYIENPRAAARVKILERETGVEPATSTLARPHSPTEFLPLGFLIKRNIEESGKCAPHINRAARDYIADRA